MSRIAFPLASAALALTGLQAPPAMAEQPAIFCPTRADIYFPPDSAALDHLAQAEAEKFAKSLAACANPSLLIVGDAAEEEANSMILAMNRAANVLAALGPNLPAATDILVGAAKVNSAQNDPAPRRVTISVRGQSTAPARLDPGAPEATPGFGA